MINKKLLNELKQILLEEFNLNLDSKELTGFATSLIGYFDLLLKIDWRNRYDRK